MAAPQHLQFVAMFCHFIIWTQDVNKTISVFDYLLK